MRTTLTSPLPLRPGETVLWEGAPIRGLHQRGKAIFLMVFGLPFLLIGVALFFYGLRPLPKSETLADAGLALFSTAFGLLFGGIGAFLLDSGGDLGITKAGFENIAEGEKVFHLIRDLQGKPE